MCVQTQRSTERNLTTYLGPAPTAPLWSPALQDRKWATTTDLSSEEDGEVDNGEEGTGDRIDLGETVSREYHISQKKGGQLKAGRGRGKPGIWVIDKMTIRPKVSVGCGHKHCLPQGQ